MDEKNKKILEIMSNIINQNVIVVAICGATIGLAQKGLLNNRKHTGNVIKMICHDYTGESCYTNKPAVVDDNLITASGLAQLEFSYEVFKKLNIMKDDTLEAWFQLYNTRESKYFYSLMESLK